MRHYINQALFVGKNLITIKEVDSTNNYAKDLLSNTGPVPEGTVILAEAQTAGRGQAGSSWLSEAGKNLTFTIILYPLFLQPRMQFYLSIITSLGIDDALRPLLGPALRIKWPNDIFFGEQKLGGILIENILSGNLLRASVLGVGINVNQRAFPGIPRAVSMQILRGQDTDLQELILTICHTLEQRYLQLKAGHFDRLREAYQERLLGFGETRHYLIQGRQVEGIIRDVGEEGKLWMETEGKMLGFDRKELVFL